MQAFDGKLKSKLTPASIKPWNLNESKTVQDHAQMLKESYVKLSSKFQQHGSREKTMLINIL